MCWRHWVRNERSCVGRTGPTRQCGGKWSVGRPLWTRSSLTLCVTKRGCSPLLLYFILCVREYLARLSSSPCTRRRTKDGGGKKDRRLMRNGKNGSARLLTVPPFRINEKKKRKTDGNIYMVICLYANGLEPYWTGLAKLKDAASKSYDRKCGPMIFFFTFVRIHFITGKCLIQKNCNTYFRLRY